MCMSLFYVKFSIFGPVLFPSAPSSIEDPLSSCLALTGAASDRRSMSRTKTDRIGWRQEHSVELKNLALDDAVKSTLGQKHQLEAASSFDFQPTRPQRGRTRVRGFHRPH